MSDTLKKVPEVNPDVVAEGMMEIEIGKELLRRGKNSSLARFCMEAAGVSPQEKVNTFLTAFHGAVMDEVNLRFRVPKSPDPRSLTTNDFIEAAAQLTDPTLNAVERSRGVARLKRLMRNGQVR